MSTQPDEEVYTQDPDTLAKITAMMDERIAEKEDELQEDIEEISSNKKEEPRLETERNTTFDSSNLTQGALYAWSMMTPELVDVEVSDLEKSKYLKAVLNDVPVVFDIELEMGDDEVGNVHVELRTLSNYETDVVFVALERDREAGLIQGHHQLATQIQQYAGALQLIKFQDKRQNHLSFDTPGDIEGDAENLRTFTKKHVSTMQWARWQAILTALRIFETKVKICNDAALNGNFWKPQDADS